MPGRVLNRSSAVPDVHDRAAGALTFIEPDPWPWLQRLAFQVNRHVLLRFGMCCPGPVKPVLSKSAVQCLRAVPPDVGNVMVGPHSGTHDAYLMYELCRVARRLPGGFLMASEVYHDSGVFLRAFLRRLGAIPVARGRHNPEAVGYLTDRLLEGRWCGLFPEGESYYSREVMPLECGALRMAVEATLAAGERRAPPVVITPFALVYFYERPATTLRRVEEALRRIEASDVVHGRTRSGDITGRILEAADALLEHKASEYGVARSAWYTPGRFERVHRLQQIVIEALERRYRGGVQSGFVRRRAMKVRMRIFEILKDPALGAAQRHALDMDVIKTRDIIITAPFSPEYLEKYGDLEMWSEYVRRLCVSLGMPQPNLGVQRAVIEVLPAIDVRPVAQRYQRLDSAESRTDLLIDETERLRETIQQGVDAVCAAHPTLAMPLSSSTS